ncbi:hypothetical protein B0H16DRAFT_1697292 [Mycena metata]|uniref:G domain-containing protein n=1 Tax=Mycena metata TaxID=1033252 RepID=A0AAD7HW04_9AGAR|nr:hypothetical protein B0H16DRAFT_1697292 [Mycena metata]
MTESLETQLSSLTFNEELDSTYDAIVESCPKFRILLIGRSGVGKSALINAVFGSGVAIEEHGIQPGTVPDINHEFVLPNNPRLVFHDSQGFSHGDGQNFETVLRFIRERGKRPQLEDRLHVIWLCTEIPIYGGSLFQTAEERILHSSDLKVPIVIVFTKFDKPVNKIKRKLPKTVDRDKVARDAAKDKFQKDYAESLSTLPASIPHVEVSKHIDFKDTLDQLVDLTEKEVKGAMSYVWASSQCPSADLKIKASIQILERVIEKSEHPGPFSEQVAGRCVEGPRVVGVAHLPVTHLTIHQLLGLRRPSRCKPFRINHFVIFSVGQLLKSNLFKTKMTTLQEDLLDDESSTFPKIPLGAVATVAGIVSGVIPPAAPFAIPIAAGLVFAAWVYKVYLTTYEPLASSHQMFMSRRSPQVLRGLMGYIIDLTIVMQSLFWLTRARAEAKSKAVGDPIATVPLSKRLVELAYKAYATDEHSRTVHAEIRTGVELTKITIVSTSLGLNILACQGHKIHNFAFSALYGSVQASVGLDLNPQTKSSSDQVILKVAPPSTVEFNTDVLTASISPS